MKIIKHLLHVLHSHCFSCEEHEVPDVYSFNT